MCIAELNLTIRVCTDFFGKSGKVDSRSKLKTLAYDGNQVYRSFLLLVSFCFHRKENKKSFCKVYPRAHFKKSYSYFDFVFIQKLYSYFYKENSYYYFFLPNIIFIFLYAKCVFIFFYSKKAYSYFP